MKKIIKLASCLILTVFLTSCSILPTGTSKGIKTILPGEKTSPLEAKVILGSIWRTVDGGNSFESKSKLDQAAVAALASQNNDSAAEKKPDDGKNLNGSGTIDNKAKTKINNSAGDLISTADILSVAFHPTKQNTIVVSTANDGLFKTENNGDLWKPISFPPKNVYSFIIDKNDPDNRMFASGVVGDWGKIFRTKDSGNNWEEVYTEPGTKIPVTGLAQHIKDNKIIFAGTKSGTVVKSTDAGDTWKNVGQLEDYRDPMTDRLIVGDKITGNVSDFAFDAKNKASIYLITYGAKLFYSRNTGDRWIDWELAKQREVNEMVFRKEDQKKINAFRERMQTERMPNGIVSVVADPKIAGLVYVGTTKGYFVSDSYGKWWKEVNIIESAKKFPIRSTAINPGNSSEIVFVSGKAFYKSVNSGKTWEVVGLDVDRDVAFVAYDPFDPKDLFVGLRKFN
jgi:hypothetical protein